MLLTFKTLTDTNASIESTAILRIRPAYGDYEPQNSTFIDYVSAGLFSSEKYAHVLSKVSAAIKLVSLHSPVGTDVALNVHAIAAIIPADPNKHHNKARSVAVFKPQFLNPLNKNRGEQQLHETEKKATKAISDAAG